jgi:methionyl-tRNA formyltransferase
MLPEVVWALPPRGSINLHASLLPDYRGAAPIHWAVMNGERETGVTTFQLAHEIDTGGILLQQAVPIAEGMTTGELYPVLMQHGATLLALTVRGLAEGSLRPTPQYATRARHHAPKLTPENTQLEWARPAAELVHFVRGLSPQPAAWTTLSARQLKLYQAQADPAPTGNAPPGTLRVDKSWPEAPLAIATGAGWLRPTDLQLEGRKRLNARDFVNGMPGLEGQRLV